MDFYLVVLKTSLWLCWKPLFGGLLDRRPSRCDSTCGQRNVAGDIFETDSEGNVLEAPAALCEQGGIGGPDCRMATGNEDRLSVKRCRFREDQLIEL